MQLTSKVALITGGGTGIGFGIAQAFAAAGAQVIITGRREDKLKEAVAGIAGAKSVRGIAADVSDRAQAAALVLSVTTEFGRIDILVNNAGVNIVERDMQRLSPEDWDYVMQVNATGVFNLIHAVLPGMRERQDGLTSPSAASPVCGRACWEAQLTQLRSSPRIRSRIQLVLKRRTAAFALA